MKQKRIIASMIDWGIIIILAGILSVILPSYQIYDFEIIKIIINLLVISIYISFKDLLFRNASLGKAIVGLRIVKINDKERASIYSVIMRNVVLLIPIIWWLEFYKVVKNQTIRQADIWFKTQVVTIIMEFLGKQKQIYLGA